MIGYACFEHEATAATRPVFHRGNGPVVLLLHELSGLTPQCLDLADRLVARELHVVLPLLFGRPAQRLSRWRRSAVCLSREVDGFTLGRSSPLTGWLCSLARRLARELNRDRPIGVVGLGLSASFVLSLVADGLVEAPALAHPTLPLGLSAAARRDLKISPGELAAARQQVEERRLHLLGLRFSADRASPADRFRSLAATFGSSFREIEIDSTPGNPSGISTRAHALLTDDYRDEPGHPTKLAFERVAAFLRLRLCT
jgi:dienelactone hydrolase